MLCISIMGRERFMLLRDRMRGSRRRSLLLRRVCRRGLRRGVVFLLCRRRRRGGEESRDLGIEKYRCVGRVFSKKFDS